MNLNQEEQARIKELGSYFLFQIVLYNFVISNTDFIIISNKGIKIKDVSRRKGINNCFQGSLSFNVKVVCDLSLLWQ